MSLQVPLPSSFSQKKQAILAALSVPSAEYDDLSPKGSVDEGIRDLIDEINSCDGYVTTSSCAGRVSIFAEGQKKKIGGDDDGQGGNYVSMDDHSDEPASIKLAGVGGKGGGGRWLFVSHEPVDQGTLGDSWNGIAGLLGMHRSGAESATDAQTLRLERLVHFKFEPMILHVLTASLSHAHVLLNAALQAGFRESGALNLISTTAEPPTPMVAIRSMGLGLESIVGKLGFDDECICIVKDSYLHDLLNIANERFTENTKRINRFRSLLFEAVTNPAGQRPKRNSEGSEWEDSASRRERKRKEGLKRAQKLREQVLQDEEQVYKSIDR